MSQSQRIVAATKAALRERGLTYADVAWHLGLSEASIKRLFARGQAALGQFPLERLEAIAGLLGLELGEIVRRAERLDPLPRALTIEQEQQLIERPKLLLVFYLLVNDHDLDRIVANYEVERPEGILLLRDLEAMGLIERRLGDQVRLRVSREVTWQPGGPIRRFIHERVLREYLGGDFDGANDTLHFVSGMISPAGIARLRSEIERLVRRFNEQLAVDSEEPLERREGGSLLVALRPWRFSLFTEYERTPGRSQVRLRHPTTP
ncbi:MAG: helix-turn-helix transcriptional regulator [Nitrococcus sp.]|nr:helix-turn-helix transcriptional regulator [Nitrococcus sp.]